MSAARRHRRLTAWIALVAMLAFALMPTLSRALAFTDGSGAWAEICTPQGMKLVALATDGGATGDAVPQPGGLQLDHCAFCALAGQAVAPPPAAPVVAVLPLAAAAPPARLLQAPRTLHAWRSAQPRAPPVLG